MCMSPYRLPSAALPPVRAVNARRRRDSDDSDDDSDTPKSSVVPVDAVAKHQARAQSDAEALEERGLPHYPEIRRRCAALVLELELAAYPGRFAPKSHVPHCPAAIDGLMMEVRERYPKIGATVDIVASTDDPGRYVVFAERLVTVAMVAEICIARGVPAFCFVGDLSSDARADVLDEWRRQTHGVLVMTYGSGGVGLNLQVRCLVGW